MNRTNLALCCAIAIGASVVSLALPIHAAATSVVYDSLSGYSPEYKPTPPPSWLNGNVEQGVLISQASVGQRLVKAEFLFRSDFLELTTTTTMRFYSHRNGAPAVLLATAQSSINIVASSIKKVSVDLPAILLPVDPVWVTWSFGFPSNSYGVTLGATTTIGNDYGKRAYREGRGWITDSSFDMHGVPALRLTAVPEPSTAALCCCALSLLAAGRGVRSLPTRLGDG